MEIVIHESATELARIAGDIFENVIRNVEKPVLGLATGSSPLGIYAELVRRHREEDLSFAHARAFTLDEYVGLPQGHEQSYSYVIRKEFIRHVDILEANVFTPDVRLDGLATVGERYDAAIKASGGVDIQLLGIGTDGHIAFNEPGSSLASRSRVKTLTEQTRIDNARFFDSIDDVPVHAITQGLGTILEAKHLVMIALGESKAHVVAQIVEGAVTSMWPGSALQLHPHATVLLDEGAASELKNVDYYKMAVERKPKWQRF